MQYRFERSYEVYEGRLGRKMSIKAETATAGAHSAVKMSSANATDHNTTGDLLVSSDLGKPVEPPVSPGPNLPSNRFGFSLSSPRKPQWSQKPRSPLAVRRTPTDGVAKLLRLGRSETVSHRQPKLSPLKSTQRDFKQRRPNTKALHPVSFHGVHQILGSLQSGESKERKGQKIHVTAAPKEEMISGCLGDMGGNTLGSTQGPPLVPTRKPDVKITATARSGDAHTLSRESGHAEIGSSAGNGKSTTIRVQKERNRNDENENPCYLLEASRGGNTSGKSLHPRDSQIESPQDPFTDIPAIVYTNSKSVISTNQLDKSAGDRVTPLRTITPPEQQLHPISRTLRQQPITSVAETPFSQSSTPGLPIFPVSSGDAGNPGRINFYQSIRNKEDIVYQPPNTNQLDRHSQSSGVRDGENRGVGQGTHDFEHRYRLTESSNADEPTAQGGVSVGVQPRTDNTGRWNNLQPPPNRRLLFTPTLTDQPEGSSGPATVQGLNAPGRHPPGGQSTKPNRVSGSEPGLSERTDIQSKFSRLRIQGPVKEPGNQMATLGNSLDG